MSLPIIMHVNYCEQGQTLEEICMKAVEWGFDGVEFRRKRSGVNEGVEEYLDNLKAAVDKSGLKYVIFGAPGADLTVSDEAVRIKEVNETAQFFELAAKRFKLTVCNTMAGAMKNPAKSVPYSLYENHGSFIASDDQWKWAADGYKKLGDVAEKLGFKLAFETHMVYIHDLPLQAKKLVDMIDSPAVGINLDYGNTVYFKEVPALKDTIEATISKLYYVHLKNSINVQGSRVPTALSEGEINHRQYLKLLKDNGYKGPICIEAPRSGDREWYAKQDLAYIKSVIAEVGI